MATKIRINKKQALKQPDEFISASGRLIGYAKKNEKLFIIGSFVLVLVFLAASFSVYYIKRSGELSFKQLATALATDKDPAKKKQELQKIKSAAFSSAAPFASFFLAQTLVAENKLDLAKAELKPAMSVKDGYFRGAAYNMMSDILIQEKKYDEALETVKKGLELTAPPARDELLLKQAYILEAKNNPAEAKKIYAELKKNAPEFYLIKYLDEKTAN